MSVARTICPRDTHSILVLCQLCERQIVVSNDGARSHRRQDRGVQSAHSSMCLLPDGTNANHVLVKNGWCWWYRKLRCEIRRAHHPKLCQAAQIGMNSGCLACSLRAFTSRWATRFL